MIVDIFVFCFFWFCFVCIYEEKESVGRVSKIIKSYTFRQRIL